MVTEQEDLDGENVCVAVWDVSRAHLYGRAERAISTNLAEELEEKGFLAKLLRSMNARKMGRDMDTTLEAEWHRHGKVEKVRVWQHTHARTIPWR